MTRQERTHGDEPLDVVALLAGLNRRKDAASRSGPLPGCPYGHRDPLLCRASHGRGDPPYGLDRHELIAEIRRCASADWRRWELLARFGPVAA